MLASLEDFHKMHAGNSIRVFVLKMQQTFEKQQKLIIEDADEDHIIGDSLLCAPALDPVRAVVSLQLVLAARIPPDVTPFSFPITWTYFLQG